MKKSIDTKSRHFIIILMGLNLCKMALPMVLCELQGMGEGIEDWEGRRYVSRKQTIISDVAWHGIKRKKNYFMCTCAKVTSIAKERITGISILLFFTLGNHNYKMSVLFG